VFNFHYYIFSQVVLSILIYLDLVFLMLCFVFLARLLNRIIRPSPAAPLSHPFAQNGEEIGTVVPPHPFAHFVHRGLRTPRFGDSLSLLQPRRPLLLLASITFLSPFHPIRPPRPVVNITTLYAWVDILPKGSSFEFNFLSSLACILLPSDYSLDLLDVYITN
jgi:hypothetical protein